MVFKNRKSLWKAERSITRVYQWKKNKNHQHTMFPFSFYQIFIFSQVWSWEFAAIGKCIRSENPAQEKGTLLFHWSVPYKILTECTLIIDIKGASIHTSVWCEKKRNMEQTEETIYPCPIHHVHFPPQKNQARYYDLFKCFQLKHLLTYCSTEVF